MRHGGAQSLELRIARGTPGLVAHRPRAQPLEIAASSPRLFKARTREHGSGLELAQQATGGRREQDSHFHASGDLGERPPDGVTPSLDIGETGRVIREALAEARWYRRASRGERGTDHLVMRE